MRSIKSKIIGMLLLLSMLLAGCGSWKNYVHTESSLKSEAERALEEKYDEEFVIYDAWTKNQTTFYVTSSPKNDIDIVFEAEIYKDGSGIYKDEYVQGVVAKQVNEKFKESFHDIFGECYVRSTVRYVKTDFKDVTNVTIEDYMKQYDVQGDFSFWGVDVFILSSQISNETIEMEYELFANKIQEEIASGSLPHIVIDLYFVDEEKMKWCEEYFSMNSKCYTEFYSEVEACPKIGIGYPEKSINKSYEEYKKLRTGIKVNE